jgi:hypothetical protein
MAVTKGDAGCFGSVESPLASAKAAGRVLGARSATDGAAANHAAAGWMVTRAPLFGSSARAGRHWWQRAVYAAGLPAAGTGAVINDQGAKTVSNDARSPTHTRTPGSVLVPPAVRKAWLPPGRADPLKTLEPSASHVCHSLCCSALINHSMLHQPCIGKSGRIDEVLTHTVTPVSHRGTPQALIPLPAGIPGRTLPPQGHTPAAKGGLSWRPAPPA